MHRYLTDLITDWLKRRKSSQQADLNRGIWADMGDMFQEFVGHMNNEEDPTLDVICTMGRATNEITQAQMPLCTNIVRVISYMEERLNSSERQSREQETDREVKKTMRCIIGKVNLMALREEYCGATRMWAYITEKAQELATALDPEGGRRSNQCHSWDISRLSLGGRDIEQEIRTWISKSALYEGMGYSGLCTTGQGASGTVQYKTKQEITRSIVQRTQQLREKVQEIVTKVEKETADLIPSTEQSNSHGPNTQAAHPKAAASPVTTPSKETSAQHSGVHDGSGSDDDYVATTTKQDARTPQADKPAATKPATTKPVTGGGGDKNGAKPSAPSAAGTSGTGTSSGQPRSDSSAGEGQPAAAGSGAGGQGPGQAPGPGQQPPPPPPPPEPARPAAPKGEQGAASSTGGSTTPTNKSGAEAQTPQATVTNNEKGETQGKKAECTKHVTESHAGQSGRGQYADPIDDSRGGTGGSSVSFTVAVTTPECSDTGGSATEHTTSKDGHGSSAVAGAAPAAPESQPLTPVSTMGQDPDKGSTPDVVTTISSSTSGAPPTQTDPVDAVPGSQAPVHSVDDSTAEPAGQGVAVGNDDPPPLNPPKPKPNPNPDQSGSSGSGGGGQPPAAGTAGGSGGGGGGSGISSSSGPGSNGDQNPASSGPGSTGVAQSGSSGTTPHEPSSGTVSPSGGTSGPAAGPPTTLPPPTPPSKPFDPKDLVPYTPAIIPAVVGIGLIAFFLWKYFAYLAKRRRTYRTVRDVPSPPLDEAILDHLQRGELPPPDYGYTMSRDRPPASAAERRGRRQPRVNRRTIIDLHLEVLNECDAAEWESVKDDYLQILVEEFMGDGHGHSSSPASSSNRDSPTKDSTTLDSCPLNEDDPDPWSCMETIQLERDSSPPNEHDPWSCMDTIQLDSEQSRAHSDHGDATAACTNWINWIDRNKHLLRECTAQAWFLQLKADWKQYLREHMVAEEDNGVSGQRELGESATPQINKLDAWKEWVAQQHRQMSVHRKQEWCKHLLNNVEEATVSQKGEVPRVEKHLEVDKVMGTEHMLRVTHVPRTQLHTQPYMQKRLTAKTWILILALVIEQCELECRLQQTELHVDALLQQCSH
ncbi:hypothetical protein AK88_05255 [Plasmodium fragile]|uniref:Schizont-infected cell agglutination C-terminal domain-containing protein n=1 Tax=Plasmodium fragile TaxID=5857 RepID=A0A0D9QHE3_PLAFR|nr:uncharacterized protein AK88_05255 [Plasmodium fragile]XP_012338491.1 uncharacterized protein AK88_05466 [Plasmodium fragile]KJP84905.1 hypothetical protein AK88_05466 [Plasmodium fragile]KJP85116.1 hypothetical protein AK88_05255 [Plasmodium fragile]